MSTQVKVTVIPSCDLCRGVKTQAYADAKLKAIGGWANVCKRHFNEHGCSLGTGRGQELILATEEASQDDRIKEYLRGADFEHMTFEDFEDMFEDRDPFEFL